MKLRIGLALLAFLVAMPAAAELKSYTITGDQSTLFPTCGTILRPRTQSGIASISDDGSGSPTLVGLHSQNTFIDIVGGTTTTGIPGTTVTLNSRTAASPSPNQVGVGSTSTVINWGSLTGWTQTGRLACITNLPGDPGPQLPQPGDPSSCVLFVGFEGTGPPAPLNGTVFSTDPWTFTVTSPGTGEHFSSPSTEFVNLGGGAVRANIQINGGLLPNSPVPALPLVGVAGLGAALLYLGARAVRSRSR
jgi:hypothetical protein